MHIALGTGLVVGYGMRNDNVSLVLLMCKMLGAEFAIHETPFYSLASQPLLPRARAWLARLPLVRLTTIAP